jgi:hypothetical protein
MNSGTMPTSPCFASGPWEKHEIENLAKNFRGKCLIFSPFQAILKISEPYDNSFWEKSNPAEEREKDRREITSILVDT